MLPGEKLFTRRLLHFDIMQCRAGMLGLAKRQRSHKTHINHFFPGLAKAHAFELGSSTQALSIPAAISGATSVKKVQAPAKMVSQTAIAPASSSAIGLPFAS